MAVITATKHFKNQPSYGYYALANAANQILNLIWAELPLYFEQVTVSYIPHSS